MQYPFIVRAVGAGLLGLALVGCDDPSDRYDAALAAQRFDVRVVHASPDAPNVNAELEGIPLARNLGFKEATRFVGYPGTGQRTVQVDGLVPGGEVTVIGPAELSFEAGTSYSVIAVGPVVAIEPLIIANPTSAVPAGNVRAQVVHGAPVAPEVDVFVTAPGADLTQAAPLGSFPFKGTLGPAEIPAGEYQIRVTLPGDPGSVVFDSGVVALPDGGDLLIVAVENTGPGAAPISLLVTDGVGTFEILDAATPTGFRVVHAAPDAPPVDIFVNGGLLLESVPFPAFSDFVSAAPGDYQVTVTAENNPGAIVIDAPLALEAGQEYSIYAAGPLAGIEPYVLVDDRRSVATEARVRIVHLSPSAGLVDIYVTAPGTDIATVEPAFAGVDFKGETGYVSLAGSAYDVTVTVAGAKTAAIGPATITVADGGVYTAVARDAPGDAPPFGLILLDDFN
jgi:hypothetical protein